MKNKPFNILLFSLLACFIFTSVSWAGQVVTDDAKVWAKKAIEQEKTLDAVTASDTLAVLYFHNKTEWEQLDLLEKGLAFMLTLI